MEEVPSWVPFTGWGGLVAVAVIAMFKGWLLPRGTVTYATVNLIVGQLEARLADRDALITELRKTNALQDARSDLLQSQVAHLVDLVEGNHALIEQNWCRCNPSSPPKMGASSRVSGVGDPGGQAAAPPRGVKATRRKATGRRR